MNTQTKTAEEFVEEWIPNIHIDRSFQRRPCWTKKTCRNFILAASQNRAPYPIVVADVKTGITACKFKKESLKKYQAVKAMGKEYISLDGQNRAKAFQRLFNDEIPLFGEFVCKGKKTHHIENKVFSVLPARLQDALKDIPITIFKMEKLDYDQLHDTFLNLNSGDSLNHQEKRNAILTYISAYIREQSLIYSGLKPDQIEGSAWEKIWGFDEDGYKRSMDCEWTAKAYMATLPFRDPTWSLNKGDVDRFYNQGKGKNQKNVSDYRSEYLERFNSILNKTKMLIASQAIHQEGRVPQKEWWLSLYVAERVLVDEQTYINSYSKLYSILHRIDKRLVNESAKEKADAIEKWQDEGETGVEPAKTDYYFHWASMAKSASDRKKRKDKFFEALYKDEGFIKLLRDSQKLDVA